MALTPSNMIPLGSSAIDFTLTDVISNQAIQLFKRPQAKAYVIIFMCNHCPFVQHIEKKLVDIAKHYQSLGVDFIAINANDIQNYPDDAPIHMKARALEHQYSFPYLFDETQGVAKQYQAACTPDFYIFSHEKKCLYRGRFDDSTPGNQKPVTGKDLSQALDAILSGHAVDSNQFPSIGCNIKWKSAN